MFTIIFLVFFVMGIILNDNALLMISALFSLSSSIEIYCSKRNKNNE